MKCDKVLISVIIPMYKVEPYLVECLDSVVAQTLRDIEIILIDDGSPDLCGQIADEYAREDSRVKVVHQENNGVGQARNAGLAMVSGEYVYILDSDDWLALDALEKMYQKAQETNADIVMINYLDVFPGEGHEKYHISPADPPPWLKFAGCGACLRLIRRELLCAHKELRFPENIWTGQDAVFSFMLDFFTDKLEWQGDHLLFRRHRSGSKQQSLGQQRKKVLSSISNALCFWNNFINSHNELEERFSDAFILILCNLFTYTKLPLWFKLKKVFEYRKLFWRLNARGKVNWLRTPRVWWIWKYGLYVPPTHLRSLIARVTGRRLCLADRRD